MASKGNVNGRHKKSNKGATPPNAFFIPLPSDQLHTSSCQNSLHSSSSSVPSTSSVPSLSGLRVRVANTPISPSIDSAPTPNATTLVSQNLQFKNVLEYDNIGRLRIIPYRNGFIPIYAAGHMVLEEIKPFLTKSWNSWSEIP
ncbi:hypothetical protein P3L10_017480 [Capsicum annuum]